MFPSEGHQSPHNQKNAVLFVFVLVSRFQYSAHTNQLRIISLFHLRPKNNHFFSNQLNTHILQFTTTTKMEIRIDIKWNEIDLVYL